ncbi:Hypothetical protein, putative [Bodo saltans]|uniref:Bifunctional lysine-specific demethylase and histidyl-hydroxylase n=1 Tax=Bodo saltans TaxID=75058 RepID=A0A0S4KG50_BODSA|nr:Hypothetical protein, putative [Bodo saltans]|eukprot:CUI14636.1 Hypothetical protein, putative [Bodo saltans]
MKGNKKRPRDGAGSETTHVPAAASTANTEKYDAFFQFLLGVTEREFFHTYFEKKPLHFKRSGPADFFRNTTPPLCSSPLQWSGDLMRRVCRDKSLMFTTDINIVKYKQDEKKRVPFQLSGRVDEPTLSACIKEGWSVRFLRPHEHSPSMAEFVSTIEEVFQCSSGVNSYWTPKGSQGFAPHYDDVDVFLLQLEGSKRWRLHEAPLPSDRLSRHSSEDYKPNEIGPAMITTTLRAGDVLYMPRGTVHQGDTYATDPQEDSLHVTFSAFQMHSMADMLLRITQFQIETLAANNVDWRLSFNWRDQSVGGCTRRRFPRTVSVGTAVRTTNLMRSVLPMITTTLRAGDVLYMPRGTVHQGDTYATDPQEDSLHVTFSAFQMHSMADMLLRITQFQIETLAANNVDWRRGVPRSWFRTLGAAYGRGFAEETGVCALHPQDASVRAANLKRIRTLVTELNDALQSAAAIDNGVDRYALDVLAKAQPPVATSGLNATVEYPTLTIDHCVKLASSNCLRLVMYVPEEAQVFHNGHNSRVCLETSLGHLRFEREFAAAVATLMSSFPTAVRVGDLPMPFEEEQDANDNRLLLVQSLLEARVLVVAK